MVPNRESNKYDFVLYNQNGKEIYRVGGDRSELSTQDAAQAVAGDEGLVIKNSLFASYLDNMIIQVKEQSLYKSSEETIRDLLQ